MEELQKKVDKLEQEEAARKKLQITEEEKQQQETQVLTSIGREYSLLTKGMLELQYMFNYQYFAEEQIKASTEIEPTNDHLLTHTLTATYGMLDNLSASMNIPFVYAYNKVGTSSAIDQTDIGDISAGLQYQPIKQTKGGPAIIINSIISTPTGRSPYKINTENELSTGNGVYMYSLGTNFSQPIDPLVLFGNIGYLHRQHLSSLSQQLTINGTSVVLNKVSLGDSVSIGFGFGYALSYMVSISQQISIQYIKGATYTFATAKSKQAAYTSAVYTIGSGWRISPKTSIFTNLDIGLTPDQPNFAISFRVPFDFAL